MKRLISLAFLLCCLSPLFAQNQHDSIEVKKSFGTVFKQNGRILTVNQLVKLVESNPDARKEMKIAKSNYTVNTIFGSLGGAMVGYPLGTAIAGGDPEWVLAGIGAGLFAVSIPFAIAYVKHAKNAVNIHNRDVKTTGMKIDYRLGLTSNGIALKLTF